MLLCILDLIGIVCVLKRDLKALAKIKSVNSRGCTLGTYMYSDLVHSL
jgi:hypothetical protein